MAEPVESRRRSRLVVTKGKPWRITETRAEQWTQPAFLRKHARPVRQAGDKILHQRALRPRALGPAALEELAGVLFASMVSAGGVGIAAPQVGIPLRVAIMDVGAAGIVAIDPKIQWTGDESWETTEACLSLLGYSGDVHRPAQARMVAHDIFGREFVAEGELMGAQCMLHEVDHLDGKLYVDRMAADAFMYRVDVEGETRRSALERRLVKRSELRL